MTAFLPAVPVGVGTPPGPYYMLVLSVIFPNGRFVQLDVRASPPGTDGCWLVTCYQSVYNIAKFPQGVTAYGIQAEQPRAAYTLAIWRDAGAGKWRYGIARATASGLVVERNDFLTRLDPQFADADAYPTIVVNQVDEWFGTTYFLQEFASLESYDWSASDWDLIGTLRFSPALSFLTSPGSAAWPAMGPSRAALACSTGVVCTDPDGRRYLGFIGCCSPAPSFAWIRGRFQGEPDGNAFRAGSDPSGPSAGAGDILWADLPTISAAAFQPSAIRGGGVSYLTYTVTNPNGFGLRLGFRAVLRTFPGYQVLSGTTVDIAAIRIGPGANRMNHTPAQIPTLSEGAYVADIGIWSGTPGVAPGVLLGGGIQPARLAVDNTPPTSAAILGGLLGENGWYRSAVWVNLTAQDAVSGVAAILYGLDAPDGSPLSMYVGGLVIAGDGDHRVVFRAIDAAGNEEPLHNLSFRIDATPPRLVLTSPTDGLRTDAQTLLVTWTAADAESGIDHVLVQLDDLEPQNVTSRSSFTFVGVANGTHTIRLTAVDRAGNEDAATATIQVGTVAAMPSWLPWAVTGVAALVVAVAILLLAHRRRRGPPQPPTP